MFGSWEAGWPALRSLVEMEWETSHVRHVIVPDPDVCLLQCPVLSESLISHPFSILFSLSLCGTSPDKRGLGTAGATAEDWIDFQRTMGKKGT
jgi:hypothetical protein